MRRKITGLLLVFLLAISSVYSQISLGDLEELDYANPKKYEIGGVTISGVKYLDNNVLVTLSGLTVGDVIGIPGEEISQAIRNLWEQGLFENIIISITNVQGNLVFLNIDLQERPRMSTFAFGGVKKSEADNLRDEIKLASGDVVTDNMIIRTTNTIKGYFTEKGYLDTEVIISQIEDTLRINHVRLQIDIDKKEKVRIKSINISGNTEFDDQKVKKYLKETKEKGVFRPFANLEGLVFNIVKDIVTFKFMKVPDDVKAYGNENIKLRIFKSSKFIKEKYEEDLVNVIDKYNSVGYRDAKIVNDSMYRNPDNTVSIDLKLYEGSKYYFRNINWVGNTKYPDAFLNKVLRVEKGDVYNWELLNSNLTFNQSEDDVSSLYMNDGYLFFQANPVEVLVENDSIDLEIRVYEGKQATINKVSVSGNTRTNDHVVVRELRTRPGQLFSRADIIRTTRELAQLRYFNPETINPNIQPNPADGTVDITYEVEETSSDQIELSGGWGYGRIIGTLGVSFNNFSLRNILNLKKWRPVPTGDGQKLSVRVQSYGKGYISYSASFTEPWLGGKKPNALTLSYYHSLYSNGYPKDDPLRQSFVIDGVTVGVGRRLTWPDDYFTLYTGVNFQRYKLQNYTQIFTFGNGTGTYNNISLSVILSRNSVDQPIYPRRGSLVSVGIEFTPPFSGFSSTDYGSLSDTEKYKMIEYHKWLIQAAYFTPITGNLVLMARAKFGFLGHYNSSIGTTPFERFYLGGDGLSGSNNLDGREIVGMRGYGNETLTPEYYKQNNQGGTIYSKYTLELRYPLSLNPNATIFVATFLEAGNAWLTFTDFNPFGVYKAAGVGVRVYLPMFGLLGLDWAYGFDQVPGLPDANRGQFHFSINQSID
jgi:outer membrane protein insertion porin family